MMLIGKISNSFEATNLFYVWFMILNLFLFADHWYADRRRGRTTPAGTRQNQSTSQGTTNHDVSILQRL